MPRFVRDGGKRPPGSDRARAAGCDGGLPPERDGDHAALPGSDRRAESAARRGDRDESRGDSHRPRAGCGAQPGSRARAAAWHPRADQGQHRHQRLDADDGGVARAGRLAGSARCADRRGAPHGRRDHPRQGEPQRVGEFPRLPLDQRLERSRRHSRATRTTSPWIPPGHPRGRPSPLRPTYRDRGRHGDGRVDHLPGCRERDRRPQADARPRVAGGHHPDRPLAGHRGPDVPDGHRRRAAARCPAVAVRRGSRSPTAARLQRPSRRRRARGRAPRLRPALRRRWTRAG